MVEWYAVIMQLLSLESLSRSLSRVLGGVVGVVLRACLVAVCWRNSHTFSFSKWCVLTQCGDFEMHISRCSAVARQSKEIVEPKVQRVSENLCTSLEERATCTGDEWDCPPSAGEKMLPRQEYAPQQSCWRICQCLALRRVWSFLVSAMEVD